MPNNIDEIKEKDTRKNRFSTVIHIFGISVLLLAVPHSSSVDGIFIMKWLMAVALTFGSAGALWLSAIKIAKKKTIEEVFSDNVCTYFSRPVFIPLSWVMAFYWLIILW